MQILVQILKPEILTPELVGDQIENFQILGFFETNRSVGAKPPKWCANIIADSEIRWLAVLEAGAFSVAPIATLKSAGSG